MAYIARLDEKTFERINKLLYNLMDTDDYFRSLLKNNQMELIYAYMLAIDPYVNDLEAENSAVCLDQYFAQKLKHNSVEEYKTYYKIDDMDTLEIDSDFIASNGGKKMFENSLIPKIFTKLIISDTRQILNTLFIKGTPENMIKTVVIKGLKKIPDDLLRGYSELEDVIIEEGTEELGSYVFQDCGSSRRNLHIQLPQSLKKLSHSAFFKCWVHEIRLPKNITKIGDMCLSRCEKLRKVIIEGDVTSIGHLAFWGDTELWEIDLPESLQSIGREAFSGTPMLELKLGKNIQSIGEKVFTENLEVLYIESMYAKIPDNPFEDTERIVVHCKENSTMDKYCKIHEIPCKYI